MDRRSFLVAGAAVVSGAALSGCGNLARRLQTAGTDVPKEPIFADSIENRRLNRIGFGPNRRDLAELKRTGWPDFVKTQLSADQKIDGALEAQLRSLDVFHLSSAEMADLGEKEALRQLQQAAILQAVYSPNQLLERMVDFWSNHFSIYAPKVYGAYRKPQDELDVIRRHALGKFPELLKASATSPAMLAFLDNTENRGGVANENYARELMELHTLGVGGGYSQQDVREVARCFTGWTVENRFMRPRGRFLFDPERHDDGAKVVLGHRIPAGGGKKDGVAVLNILAGHPQTARFISGKICRHFLGDSAEPWIEPTAKTFLASGGDIRAVLEPILLSKEMAQGEPIVKRPFDFMVGALRRFEAETDAGKPLQAHLERMGQPLYQWPMPDGFPSDAESWSGSLLPRWNFVLALMYGQIRGTRTDLDRLALQDSEAFRFASPGDARVALKGPMEKVLALATMGPASMWR